mmetsp:Transcript_35132/g.47975  ORF Transcript_35132/g.47975 Transcript_35132/m.47975 type:complete len:585 (+) Transcript_35132:189-1943(+)|eukprot:CAMPEP_0201489156 /NCGR_PEP_ID=MMETSP0151_2-20130828/21053_1 /ASSEMBLY_ACC=CAM_ASM_000257 /TAXON_ID=200890 /ORGANISM="Paramoeba atlantica, Strain 621/1 / CCAP 1560/9" /LENGTH=584 /DNA_ID=CAMNT_0047874645 /DNA_START=178 /DNA_END=1932 /DNA_ORIENTATION=+
MGDEQSIHSIQILIDELKNDDVELRLNSVRSLTKIAEALGPERTRTELIPFLTASATDDEDEVLGVLAEQLGCFPPFMGGPEFVVLLVSPLEQLASVEDATVREQAIASLSCICESLKPENVVSHIIPVSQRLASGEWFTMRVAASMLLPVMIKTVPPESSDSVFTLIDQLCKDSTPMVRRDLSIQLKKLIPFSEIESLKKFVIPRFVDLAKDDQDSVRLLAVENATSIAKRLTEEENISLKVLDTVLECSADKSWRVRYMVADLLHQLCEIFGQEISTKFLVSVFVRLVQDPEAEVRTVATGNVKAVCSFISSEVVLTDVIPAIKTLVNDPSQHVRVALAKIILEIAPLCGKDNTRLHLFDVFQQLLKDEFSEVRLSIISKLGAVKEFISVELLEQSLLPAVIHLAEDKQWRVRLATIDHIPLLAEQLGVAYFDEKLGPLCFSWLNDSVSSVRVAATVNLKKLSVLYGPEWTETMLVPRVLQLQKNTNYLYRLTTLFAIQQLAETCPAKVLESSLLPLARELSEDRVPNIRLNAAKSLQIIHPFVGAEGKKIVMSILAILQDDSDSDVKFHANEAVSEIGKEN